VRERRVAAALSKQRHNVAASSEIDTCCWCWYRAAACRQGHI